MSVSTFRIILVVFIGLISYGIFASTNDTATESGEQTQSGTQIVSDS